MDNIEQLIDTLHLEDLNNELHPSYFDENEGYDMLIIRLPVISEVFEVKSIGFIITPKTSYLYNKKEKKFEDLGNCFEGPYKIIDQITDELLKSFSKYQEMVSDMEEALYTNKKMDDFMTMWLELKKYILRIERVLLRASSTVSALIKKYEESEIFPTNHYFDLHEHMERIMRSGTLHLAKLDYLYSFYNTRTNEKMNSLIYTLTIISAIFLPLNLAVGFFGMNTSGLPFTEGDFGTASAAGLMVSLMLITSMIVYLFYKKVKQ